MEQARELGCQELQLLGGEPLAQIVRRDLKRYWELSLDHIEVCRDCEYRHACQDCRPVAYGPTGSLTARSLYCSHDPYRGEWLQGDTRAGEDPAAVA